MRRGPAAHGGNRQPGPALDPDTQRWWARYLRVGASPSMARDLMLMNAQIDVRSVARHPLPDNGAAPRR